MGWPRNQIVLSTVLVVIQVASAALPKPGETLTLDAIMDLGYYIQLQPSDPIKVSQDPRAQDPYPTYAGCSTMKVFSNFKAKLFVRAKATSTVGGTWEATIQPPFAKLGESKIKICVVGSNVQIQAHPAAKDVKVAEVTVVVLPL